MGRSKAFYLALLFLLVLCSCGKEKLLPPEGYPSAYFPLCGCVEVTRSEVSGLEEMPVYTVDYKSSFPVEDVLAEYMVTIPKSKVTGTETGYKLTGQKDGFKYTILIESAGRSSGKNVRSSVKTSVSGKQ